MVLEDCNIERTDLYLAISTRHYSFFTTFLTRSYLDLALSSTNAFEYRQIRSINSYRLGHFTINIIPFESENEAMFLGLPIYLDLSKIKYK